jgi:hypothetical protein
MSKNNKQLSNPFSTGGGGGHFEAHVQASFVTLMLTGGYAPCLPCWPIKEIKLQGKIDGFDTDDLIVFVEKYETKEGCKLLGQIKHSIQITRGNHVFSEVIQAAWNDFNNPRVFTKGKDIIALITGPLNATDYSSVQWLLDQAKHTKSIDEFYRNVQTANFSSDKSREKLGVIQYHLKVANNNVDVSRDDLYSFLKHFHLIGYDLGNEFGVVLSLLHSHISQLNPQFPQSFWSQVVEIVQTWNQYGGTITLETLPEELKDAFKRPAFTQIPKELTITQSAPEPKDWNLHQHAIDLATANLIGAWNEKYDADLAIFSKLIGQDYSVWVQKAREIHQSHNSPFSLKNRSWKISERADLWDSLGARIFDQHLDAFKEVAITVLTEYDPSFELPKEERYASSIHGKVLTHSPELRKGIAEGLAIIGSKPFPLVNCSQRKAEDTVGLTIREIFANADWVLWGSLNNLLPLLAEAAPNEFLHAVENALRISPCPFDELFSQEGNGITGSNYLTGLLWALESLAWDEKYLVRVCVILGELANHDPGGMWANRPANSLATMLLPWFPQTMATIEKRKAAVQTLCKEWPEIGWKLIISLLPNQIQTSSGSYKPSWRITIPEDLEKGVKHTEYWQQISYYAELAISMAGYNVEKLAELIDHCDTLPMPSLNQLLKVLSSEAIIGAFEDQRHLLWDHLIKFSTKHRRFAGAEWALSEAVLSTIEVVTTKLAPSNLLILNRYLFSTPDFDLYEENGNWDDQREKIENRRQNAVVQILKIGGSEAIIQFAEKVEFPNQVGYYLGCIADVEIDSLLLPKYLGSENPKLSSFAGGYIWSRHQTKGWSWADEIDKSTWSSNVVSEFLSFLPFSNETWDRATQWLGDAEYDYWSKANVNPYQVSGELRIAIDKLIKYGRPDAAILCLVWLLDANKSIDVSQCIRALLTALSTEALRNTMNGYYIVELIKFLQSSTEVSTDDLFRVEWAYLPLLNHIRGAAPKLLENRLASDPNFFCEVIKLVYRSKKTNLAPNEPSEETKAIAANAWRLLHEWRTPPGMQEDGSFDDKQFPSWLHQVKEISSESGHLEVALTMIGEVLIYCPSDPNGLWINHTVADALNARDADDLRDGFSTGLFNSRDVHWVDPTGKPEREIAEQYQQKAEDVENAGYFRLAQTLRSLSESYTHLAGRIAAEHVGDDK